MLPINLRIPIEDVHMHSFLSSRLFWTDAPNSSSSFQAKIFCATADIQKTDCDHAWSDIKKIVDEVHKRVCGHAKLIDMQTLLERNNLWNHEVKTYFNRIVNSCSNCARCYEPKMLMKYLSVHFIDLSTILLVLIIFISGTCEFVTLWTQLRVTLLEL